MAKISNKDLFEGDLFKPTIEQAKALLKVLNDLSKGLVDLAKQNKKIASETNLIGTKTKELQKLQKAEKDAIKLAKQKEKVDKEAIKLNKQLNERTDEAVQGKIRLAQANKEQKDTLKDLLILQDKEAGTLEKINARNRQLRRERSKLNLDTEQGRKRLQEINKELDKNNKKIKDNSDQLKKQKLNVGNYTSSIKEAVNQSGLFGGVIGKLNQVQGTFNALLTITKKKRQEDIERAQAQAVANSKVTKALRSATKGMKAFNLALSASIIGAIILALSGLVVTFTRTQKNADKLSDAMASMGAILDIFLDRMALIGDAFIIFGQAFVSTFSNLVKKAKIYGAQIQLFFQEAFRFEFKAGDLAKKLGFEDFSLGATNEEIKKTKDTIKDLEKEIQNSPKWSEGIDLLTKSWVGLGDEIEKEIALASLFNSKRRELNREQQIFNAFLEVQTTKTKELKSVVLDKLRDDKERLKTAKEIQKIEDDLAEKQLKLSERDLALSIDSVKLSGDRLKLIEGIKNGTIDSNKAIAEAERLTLSSAAGEKTLFDIIEKIKKVEKDRQKLADTRATTSKRVASITKEIANKEAKALETQAINELKIANDRTKNDEQRLEALDNYVVATAKANQKRFNANIIIEDELTAKIEKALLEREKIQRQIDERNRKSAQDLADFRASVYATIQREEVDDRKALLEEELNDEKLTQRQRVQIIREANEEILVELNESYDEQIKLETKKTDALLENESLNADERKKINEELDEKIRLIERQRVDEIQDLQKKQREEEKKLNEEKVADTKKTSQEVGKVLDFLAEKQRRNFEQTISNIDKEIQASKDREKDLKELARQSVVDSSENLAFEQRKQAELEKQKEKEQERQRRRELGFTALKTYTAKVESGDKNPLLSTIKDISLLLAAIETLPGFFEGSSKVGDDLNPALNTGKDDYIIRVDGDEKIFNPEHSNRIGYDMSNEQVVSIVERFKRGELTGQSVNKYINGSGFQSNEMILQKFDQLKQTIENLPGNMPQNKLEYDQLEKAVVTITKERNKVITTHRKQGGIWGK